jgi:ElaB/YqjD/DUF883 family membrane-anchored ribosome-binding protein
MRCWECSMFLGSLVILTAAPAQAGIYNPGESEETATYPDFINSRQGRNFRDVIIILRSIPVTQRQLDDPLRTQRDNPIRIRYAFLEELIARSAATSFTTIDERLMASAVLIRRRKFKDAEQLLRPIALAAGEQDNIPIQSNFATALHMDGDLKGAFETLRPIVRDHWKKSWDELSDERRRELQRIGWTEPVYKLNRNYDTYYLKLLRLRLRERVTNKEHKEVVQLPDALFDDQKDPPSPVRFVSDDGEFEPGKLAAAERAKLPTEALAIVQQLIVWMPDDLRLYWLLGELYNAQKGEGQKENREGILAALRIFSDLEIFIELGDVKSVSEDAREQLRQRIGALTTAKERFEAEQDQLVAKNLNKIETTDTPGFTVDWRTVGISFGLGFVLAFFALWQIREIQRRRLARGIAK